jgi:hypothetical protein
MDALESDPRLRTLPLAARMLWLLLGEYMARAGTPGVLSFAQTERLSLLVSAPLAEVETSLETLFDEGLLRQEGDTLVCPLLVDAPAPRASRAAENGRKGGRPRKGESTEAYRLRRSQTNLVLPIQGDAEKPKETQPQKAYDHEDDLSNSPIIITRAPGEVLALAREVALLAGMDPARSDWSAQEVRGWLNLGATPQAIREVVADVMTRRSGPPGNLRYFGSAIARAVAENRGSGAPAAAGTGAAPSVKGQWSRLFEAHLDAGGKPGAFPKFEAWVAAQASCAA